MGIEYDGREDKIQGAAQPNTVNEAMAGYHAGALQNSYLALIGMAPSDTNSLIQRINQGISFRSLESLREALAISMERLSDLVRIAPRTLVRRKEQGVLQPDESDRVVRITRVYSHVLELFDNDKAAAVRWIGAPQRALGGCSPLEYIGTEVGAREVEDLVGRLEHGVYA